MQSTNHDNLSAYLDGELTDAETVEFEAELARDPLLRESLTELEDVVHWMRRDGPEAAPFGFHRRVMDRIEEEHPAADAAWTWWRRPFGIPLEGWLIGAAAAAALLLALPTAGPNVEPFEEASPGVLRDSEPTTQPDEGAEPPTDDVELPPQGKMVGGPPPQAQKMRKRSGDLPPIGLPVAEGPPDGVDTEDAPPHDTAPTPEVRYPAGFAFSIQSSDASMKRRVLGVASRYGVPMTVSGKEASGAFEAAHETVLVEVPTGKLAQLNDELARLGYAQFTGRADDDLVRGRKMLVRIHLELLAGDAEGAP